MLTYRVEDPKTKIGPYRNEDVQAHISMHGPDCLAGILAGTYKKPPGMTRPDAKLFSKLSDQGGPNNPHPWQEVVKARSTKDAAMIAHMKAMHDIFDYEESGSKGVRTKKDVVFGFSSPDDFARWWRPDLLALVGKYGYQEAVYSVPDDKVLQFYQQCAWRARNATLVSYRPLIQAPADATLRAA